MPGSRSPAPGLLRNGFATCFSRYAAGNGNSPPRPPLGTGSANTSSPISGRSTFSPLPANFCNATWNRRLQRIAPSASSIICARIYAPSSAWPRGAEILQYCRSHGTRSSCTARMCWRLSALVVFRGVLRARPAALPAARHRRCARVYWHENDRQRMGPHQPGRVSRHHRTCAWCDDCRVDVAGGSGRQCHGDMTGKPPLNHVEKWVKRKGRVFRFHDELPFARPTQSFAEEHR